MIILSPNTLLKGGEYRILSMLGQGGFGITYLALHTQLDVKVAIKEFFMKDFCERGSDSHVSLGSSGSREMVERFRAKFVKEAQNIARLRHANIVRVTDVFEDNGTAYYVMEFHDGGSLADLVKSNGHLSEAKAVGYARQIADALDYLHARKINHLDVKPANVLLNEDGDAVLIDFGLAKHYDSEGNQTSTTPVGISHGYAPMEQYRRGGVGTFSPTSDIYSLGATLYKLLTGVTPPDASDLLNEGLPPMTVVVSPAVRNAVEQAMSPLIKDRPQSIKAFLSLLNTPAPAVDEDKTELVPDIEPVTDETEIVSDTTPALVKKAPAPKRQGLYGFHLYGDVSKVTKKEDGVVKYIYYFNANGDVSKYEDYSFGELEEKSTYHYDSAGNLIEILEYDSFGKLRYKKYTYRYDSAGNKIEEVRYNSSGKLDWIYTYRYDSAGNMIENAHYNSDGKLLSRYTYRYDSAGNKIEWLAYDSSGELWWRNTYRYDFAGNEIETLAYDSSGKLKERETYRYDFAGNEIERVEYNSSGKLNERRTYRYDSAGNLIEDVRYNSSGKLDWRITYRYDSAGNRIGEVMCNSDGEVEWRYTYEIEYR